MQCMQGAILLWHFCPSVCLSKAGIVSRHIVRLFDDLAGVLFWFLRPTADTNYQGEPLSWSVKYTGVGKFGKCCVIYLGNGSR